MKSEISPSEFKPEGRIRRSGVLYRKDGWFQTVLEIWIPDGFFGWKLSHTEFNKTLWCNGGPLPISNTWVDWIEWSSNVHPSWRKKHN